jgi:hypothetical protein
MISEQINKEILTFAEEIDRFPAQNGKDQPNPRAARAWQTKTIKRER